MNAKRTNQKIYDLVAQKPVARFFYQGTHTHPVRRTVLVIEDRENLLVGYELREGSTVRSTRRAIANGYVRSYRKDRIARYNDYVRLRKTSKASEKGLDASTLERETIVNMFVAGV